MEKKTKGFKDRAQLAKIFKKTFGFLREHLPQGITRANRPNTTSVVLFEAISVGVAKAFAEKADVEPQKIRELLDDKTLVKYTTGATNSKKMLMNRINYVRSTVKK
jgi:hypothetical protein